MVSELDQVLALALLTAAPGKLEAAPPAHLLALLGERNAARAAKQWQRADQLRVEIFDLGYDILDAPGGTSLKLRS